MIEGFFPEKSTKTFSPARWTCRIVDARVRAQRW
jgi:hypothetical protein